jgi:hypothetical protein
MRRTFGVVLVCLTSAAAWAQAPRLLDSIPRNGDLQVDPALGWMVFVFDRDMATTGYSFCGGGPTFPEGLGTALWLDARLLVAKTELEPGHDYQFSLNCSSYRSFRDTQGRPLEPYPVVFRTRADITALLTPEVNSKAVQELRRLIDEEYSYRDLRGVDWPDLFAQYGPALIQARTASQFADIAALLLARAKDLHITVMVGNRTIPTFIPPVSANINVALLPQIVPDFSQRSSAVYAGRFPDGISYVLITTWSQDSAAALEAVYPILWEATSESGLIVDVRPNSGGNEVLARQVAGCFVEEPHVYAQDLLRSTQSAGGFALPVDKILSPNEKRPRYRGPVVVLMGQANVSSCERFLLMMRQVPNCTLIGEKSYGASGNPLPHDLGNGVTVMLPSWKALCPDGTAFEGVGLEPDIEIHATKEQLAVGDPVLDAALAWLRHDRR